jgi:hypothetical protein
VVKVRIWALNPYSRGAPRGYPRVEELAILSTEVLPSRRKSIDNDWILLLSIDYFFNRRGAESAEGIEKSLVYSLRAGRE